MADAIGPANISLNLATEEFRTCSHNNTVNGKFLEYLWGSPVWRAKPDGPWS
jgi:hypothetical protein